MRPERDPETYDGSARAIARMCLPAVPADPAAAEYASANHLVSAVDGLLTARLGAPAPDLDSEVGPEPGGPVLRLRLSVPLTN